MRTFTLTLGIALAALTLSSVAPQRAMPAEIEETPLADEPRVESAGVASRSDAGPGEHVERSLDRAGEATHEGLHRGAEPVGRGLERAMKATGRGVRKTIEKTGEGLRRAGEALSGERE
jgi:hypothetical protein